MDYNTRLSIVIPTYNRADFLDYSLQTHIPIAQKYNIPIYVSDNASTDNTRETVEKWQLHYPYLHYYRNETNVGEINFEIALRYPDTDFVWLLGDTYELPENGIKYVLDTDRSPDVFIFNLTDLVKIASRSYQNDPGSLLRDIGALMTCLSCLVYNKELIQRARFNRYYDTNFLQTGVILEDIALHPSHVEWVQNHSVGNLQTPLFKKNWNLTPSSFEIGCRRWANFIFSLPCAYTVESKMSCMMEFGKLSGLFKLKNLILLRVHGVLSIDSYRQYRQLFRLTIAYPLPMIWLLSITPKFLLKYLVLIGVAVFSPQKRQSVKKLLAHK